MRCEIHTPRIPIRSIGYLIATFAVVFALAALGAFLYPEKSAFSVYWPVVGLLTFAFIQWRWTAVVACATSLFVFFMMQDYPLQRCFEFTLLNLLGGGVGALSTVVLRRRFGETKPLSVLGTHLLSSIASSLTAVGLLFAFNSIAFSAGAIEDYFHIYQKLFMGILVGSLSLAPLLFTLFDVRDKNYPKVKLPVLFLLVLVTVISLIATIYLENRFLMFFVYVPALVSAISLDRRLVFFNSFLSSVVILLAANLGLGAFTDRWTNNNIIALQILVGSLALISIELSAIFNHGFRRRTIGIILGGWLVSSTVFMILYQDRDLKSRNDFFKTVQSLQEQISAKISSYEKMMQIAVGLIERMPEVADSAVLSGMLLREGVGASNLRYEVRLVDKEEWEILKRQTALNSGRLLLNRILFQPVVPLDELDGAEKSSSLKRIVFIVDVNRELSESLARYASELGIYVTDREGFNIFTSDNLLQDQVRHGEHDNRTVLSTLNLAGSEFNLRWERLDANRYSSNIDLALIGSLGAVITMLLAKLFAVTAGERDFAEKESEHNNQRLLKQLKLWKVLTASAPVGIFQMNSSGDIVYSNPLWESYVGNSLKSTLVTDRWALIYPDDRESTRAKWIEALISDRPFEHEYRIVKPSGDIVWLHVIASQIHDETGELEGLVGIASNISEKKRHEAALQQERIRNIQASKMANLGEMAAGVAHEINNPLALINATTCGLKFRAQQFPEDAQESIEVIEKTALRIAKIVKGLLAFSRNAEGDPLEQASVSHIVDETLALCRERFEKKLVEIRIPSIEDRVISCRPIQLSQILVILLNNAFDAVEGAEESWVEIQGQVRGSVYSIRVRNSGDKIPTPLAQKIFEPFFTTKTHGKGIGLGLSIAQGLASDHGGSLELNDKASLTEFVLTIPCGIRALSAEAKKASYMTLNSVI